MSTAPRRQWHKLFFHWFNRMHVCMYQIRMLLNIFNDGPKIVIFFFKSFLTISYLPICMLLNLTSAECFTKQLDKNPGLTAFLTIVHFTSIFVFMYVGKYKGIQSSESSLIRFSW
jgi:hypothetical protein